MLTKIHHSHRGPEYCLRFARDAVFWPNMSKDIEEFCHSCSTCAQYGKQAAAKPMLSHPIPTLPWQFVSQDVFAFGHKQYLITEDHYSDFYELDELVNTLSPTIVNLTKANFARHGIPLRCLTDNSPQFVSHEYKKFAQTFGFNPRKPRPSQRGSPWIYVQIIESTTPRSYSINKGNFVLRRNRAQLRPAAPPEHAPKQPLPLPLMQPSVPATPGHKPAQPLPAAPLQIERPVTPPPTQPQKQEQQISETPVVHVNQQTNRSGRVVRLPQKYKDFVLS